MEQHTGSKFGQEYDKTVYCHFVYFAECIMRNAGLDEAQAGIKFARRNINLGYADDTTLIAESEEELKNLLMKVKEESKKAGIYETVSVLDSSLIPITISLRLFLCSLSLNIVFTCL